MGYSNKRRRYKRKRTRTLNAIQNIGNTPKDFCLSDVSSVDIVDPSSSYTSFCSTFSHDSYTAEENQTIPNSIFLEDDVNSTNRFQDVDWNNNHDAQEEDSGHGQKSMMDQVDEHFNFEIEEYPLDGHVNIEEDDVTVQSATSSLKDSDMNSGSRCYPVSHEAHHRFDEMTMAEIASYKIMTLLDEAGAPRICYNRLVALLKKLVKNDGFDVKKALNRETLMRRLGTRCKTRPRIQALTIEKQEVFRFNFLDMLQDLLYSSSKHLHIISPNFDLSNPVEEDTAHELWNTSWIRETFTMGQYSDFDPNKDIMLPIILYMDKTGTDVNQRYSLEPVLFSIAAIPREQRESRHSWRHLGFVPPKQGSPDEETSSSLQCYHDCLSYLLDGLREAQKHPPRVIVKSPIGELVQRRAFLPLMVVMGDQLSQDTLCGRLKSNSGGAGRVHRSCMCSYLNIDDPYHQCKPVNASTLQLLTTQAMFSEEEMDLKISSTATFPTTAKQNRMTKSFLLKQRTMFRSILRHPFTSHPIRNAFDGIHFGSWLAGIHDATLDDFMHSVEAGMMSYISETVYDGLTKKEKETVERLTRPMLSDQRCSTISTYPRWRLQPGFSRQTLMTSGERVGSVLALSLSLHDPTIRDTIRLGHLRQVQKYLDLSPESSAIHDDCTNMSPASLAPTPELYLDQYMHRLDDDSIRHTLEHMIRHGFDISLVDDLDPFQINQMIWHCSDMFRLTRYPDNYPAEDIDGSYTDLGHHLVIQKERFGIVKYSLQVQPSKLLKRHRHRKVEGTTGKHLKKKTNKKGEGSSAAVLSANMGTLTIFLEYVLCYHAFCKYSWTLPLFLQRNYENIKAGNRFVVEYFQKLIYRGNNSVDSRFPKIHAQCRVGMNTESLNTVMNFCCETGERLLKTEAKGISRTAQQRGDVMFVSQTMSRLQDRSMLDSFAMYLGEKESKRPASVEQHDRFARTYPHFVYDTNTGDVFSVNRQRERQVPDDRSGYLPSQVLDALKRHEPQIQKFDIYNEVVLRDNSRLRACPNYTNLGPWYDYVNVSWECERNGVVETYLLPSRCICFFSKEWPLTDDCEILALVHTVDHLSAGKVPGRTDTLLTRNYRMQYDSKGIPVTHVVPVASIDSSIRCFQHRPSKVLFDIDSPGITYLLPRNHWAYLWMAVNEALTRSNSNDQMQPGRGKMISLCSNNWLENVRERYQKYLNAKHIDDL